MHCALADFRSRGDCCVVGLEFLISEFIAKKRKLLNITNVHKIRESVSATQSIVSTLINRLRISTTKDLLFGMKTVVGPMTFRLQ